MHKSGKFFLLVSIFLLAAFLRLYRLDSVPASLNWDEASLGYNAYSILKTARDEHGKFLPLTNFGAFGDYKPPLYVYFAVPSIAIFSLNEFAIRFPSAFFGILTVGVTYLLALELFKKSAGIKIWKLEITAPNLAAIFLAISPWHLQFSRGAFEGNLGLFFSVLGTYCFFKFASGRRIWILAALLSFVAGMYTFTGQRLFAPLMLVLLFWTFRKKIFRSLRIVIPSILVFIVIFYPLFKFATGTIEGRLRFEEVTIFRDLKPINDSISYREKDGFSFYANIFHNRRIFIFENYLKHYLDAFNPKFLFTRGDVNPRLSIQEAGELYYVDLLLLLAGLFFLTFNKQKYRYFLILWLLIAPLGPSTARETPHALRMIHILPSFQLLTAFGFVELVNRFRFRKLMFFGLLTFLVINFGYYSHFYFGHYKADYSSFWQYGYKQAVEEVKPLLSQADTIYVNTALGRPYIYFLLYLKYDPATYQRTSVVVRDKFYFLDVKSFDKLQFIDSMDNLTTYGKVVYVSHTEPPADMQITKQIKDLAGNHALYIATRGF